MSLHDETSDVVNPVEVERALQKVRNDINRGVRIVNDAEKVKREAQRTYDRAYAQAFIAASCAQTEKRYTPSSLPSPNGTPWTRPRSPTRTQGRGRAP